MNIIEAANDVVKIDNKRLRMPLNCISITLYLTKIFIEESQVTP